MSLESLDDFQIRWFPRLARLQLLVLFEIMEKAVPPTYSWWSGLVPSRCPPARV